MKTRWYGFLLAGLLGPAAALADGGTLITSGGRSGSYMDGGTLISVLSVSVREWSPSRWIPS